MKWLTSGVTNGILKGSVLSCVILCCFLLWYVFLLMVVTFLLLDAFLQYTASSPCWEHFFDQNQLIYGGVQAFWMVNMVKHCRRQQQQFLMIVSTEVSSFKELLNQGYTKVITSDHQENLRNLYQRSSGGGLVRRRRLWFEFQWSTSVLLLGKRTIGSALWPLDLWGSEMKTRVCQTHLCGNEW